jgi:ATP synthase protein I
MGGGLPTSTDKAKPMDQPDALQAKRVLIAQLALTLILTAVAVPFGSSAALSVLIGSAACLLATAIFAAWVFRRYRAQRPDELLLRFYGAEVLKLAVVIGLFAVAFATVENLNLPALLGAYFVVQVVSAVFAPRWGASPKRER